MSDIPDFFETNFPHYIDMWVGALVNPRQFLRPSFAPTAEQFAEGLKFYVVVTAVTLMIFGLITLFGGRSSLTIKARMLATGLLFIVFLFATSTLAHVPMWLLGGQGTLTATLLAAIYGAGPFGPLIAFAQWIFVAGMPPRLRSCALNPATAQKAMQDAADDPETDKWTLFVGGTLGLGLLLWGAYRQISNLSFVHDLSNWRLAGALILCVVILVPFNKVFQRMGSTLYPELADGPDDQQREVDPPSSLNQIPGPRPAQNKPEGQPLVQYSQQLPAHYSSPLILETSPPQSRPMSQNWPASTAPVPAPPQPAGPGVLQTPPSRPLVAESPPPRSPLPQSRPARPPPIPAAQYDQRKWNALVESDPRLAMVTEKLRPLGQKWIDDLAASYLAAADKDSLLPIVTRIINAARQENEDQRRRSIN